MPTEYCYYHLYQALMEALKALEDAMDKESPSAGSNQGRSTKKRRSDSAASGSAKPPPKDDDQSSKKPRETEASASKQHPALTSTGWQITDTREAGVDSSMHKSDPESEHSEQSSDDISMQDEGNDSDMEDTDNAHIPKVSTTTWFKPIPESERPATPEPEWTIPQMISPEPNISGQNAYATTDKVPEETSFQRKTVYMWSFINGFCRRTGIISYCKADLEVPTFNLVKGLFIEHCQHVDKKPGDTQKSVWDYSSRLKLSTKDKHERPNWDAADYYFKEDYTIVPKPRAVVYRDRNDQRKLMRLNELHKFSDGTLTRVMEKLDQMVKDFHLYEYNKGMETRKWSEDDKRRSKDFIIAIEKNHPSEGIYRSLESLLRKNKIY
ncbi:hypothetical protein Tco_0741821 [Tanacetum coccineum]